MSEVVSVPATPVASSEPSQGSSEAFQPQLGPDGQPLPQKVEVKPEVKSNKKKLSLQVNGRKVEHEIDISNDKELENYVRKAMAADERFEEAANMRKQMQQLVEVIKTNPLAILQHPDIGVDVKQLAEQVINQQIEEMQKSPEQREREKMHQEMEQLRQQLQQEQDAKRQAEVSRLEEQAFIQLDNEIDQALASVSDMPKSPYTVKRLADAMITAVNLGYTNVSVNDVLPIVRAQLKSEFQDMFGKMPEDVLEGLLGENYNRIRKRKIAASKKPPQGVGSIQETMDSFKAKTEKQDSNSGKRIKAKDYFRPF